MAGAKRALLAGQTNPAFPKTMILEQHRKRIDEIDAELSRLLDERAAIARQVGLAKAAVGGLNTYDPGRQKDVFRRAVERSDGSFPPHGLMNVWRELLSACLNLQKPLNVGFLGPAGTFSHQAAIREFGGSANLQARARIRDMFLDVAEERLDHAVVPVENSTGGIIHETLDSFLEHDVKICSEVLLPVEHCLVGHGPLDKVRRIYSHPQTFLQCGEWLRRHLPAAELLETTTTVKGIEMAKRAKTSAAIASAIAAEAHGMKVLAEGIEDDPDNTTRFWVLARADSRRSGDDKTSVMFSTRDEPGALHAALGILARHQVNMTKIESRPTRKRAWECVFFVDLQGYRDDPSVHAAIEELGAAVRQLRILGSYPRDTRIEIAGPRMH